jgi:hypothetical protein
VRLDVPSSDIVENKSRCPELFLPGILLHPAP